MNLEDLSREMQKTVSKMEVGKQYFLSTNLLSRLNMERARAGYRKIARQEISITISQHYLYVNGAEAGKLDKLDPISITVAISISISVSITVAVSIIVAVAVAAALVTGELVDKDLKPLCAKEERPEEESPNLSLLLD